jgi:crotonobetainyl-CoA:carnitine CoA-transferase CaiB-like acyl-CoA transferase
MGVQYREDEEAHAQVAALVASRTLADWRGLLAEVDVPVEPVLSAAEAVAHPQAEARAVLQHAADGLPRLAFPARLDGDRLPSSGRYPELGQDTDRIVQELGGEAAAMSARQRRRAGVGRRWSWKRALATWMLSWRRG